MQSIDRRFEFMWCQTKDYVIGIFWLGISIMCLSEATFLPTDFVSVSQHYETKHIGLVQVGHQCHLKHFPVLFSFMTYHRVCNQINTTGVTSGAGTAYPSGAPEFTPGFKWGSCYSIFSFICMFCRQLFVLLHVFFWRLCCLFFFYIRILITSLVSSSSSHKM